MGAETEKVKIIWDKLDTWLNQDKRKMSSEKSIVFHFAWEFNKEFQSEVSLVDFETTLFQNFSDGQFLDLFMELKNGDQRTRIGIEFKFPNKKDNGSNQTATRQKIINDIKRLNWLVVNDKIDIGIFLCLTNEKGYITTGKFKKATDFLTHQGKIYSNGTELPTNDKYSEKVKALNNITFNWRHVKSKDNKYDIVDGKFSFLEPIIIKRD